MNLDVDFQTTEWVKIGGMMYRRECLPPEHKENLCKECIKQGLFGSIEEYKENYKWVFGGNKE